MEVGVADVQGQFPPDSFNGKIDAQLQQFTSLIKEFAAKADSK
jgi:hypothetical protein